VRRQELNGGTCAFEDRQMVRLDVVYRKAVMRAIDELGGSLRMSAIVISRVGAS